MNLSSPFQLRNCPLCASSAPNHNEVSSAPPAETLTYDALVPGWNGFFKEKTFFSYARCPTCGLLYAPRFFDGEQLEKLYAQMPPNMDGVPVDSLRRTQRSYFDGLATYGKLDKGYIEIGADIGLFTENCVREGQFSHYWLFEPNRVVWPTLEQTMQGKPHKIVPDMFGFGQVPDQSASAAVMIQVLDHLLDPVAMLKDLRKKLCPGGTLLIVTHNEASLLRRIFGARWPAFCMQHPQLFNPASMKALLEAAGFQTVAMEKTVNYFPLQFLVKHLLWAIGLKVKNVPSFGGLTLGLKLGNMLTVAKVPLASP